MNRALRRSAPIALALASALLLAGCAGAAPESTPTATPEATAAACFDTKSGDVSDAVTVSGDFGAPNPTATFATPVTADTLQTSVVTKGDGEEVTSGVSANLVITMFNGTSGKLLLSQPAVLAAGDTSTLDPFRSAFECQTFGSRTVTIAPADSLYGDQGNDTIGVAPGDTVVIVADVVDEYTAPALPEPGEWTENVPEVTFNGDQPPTVVIPDVDPAPDLLLKVLEQGDGDTVQSGDQVTVQYQGLNWATKEIFDQSYGKQPATFATDQVIEGFGAALVGQKVGTKLIVTIPPAQGYGTEPSDNGLGGQTLVFVVEIQATARG